jgi:CheY-like chemotaxis protein
VAKPRVLVVDDYPGARYRRMRILLEQGGFEVAEEFLGREAVRRSRDERVDLVLLDLHLPDINGFEVCRLLKADPATAGIPVLMISADADQADATRLALEAGAREFLPDTVEAGALVSAVKSALDAQPS